MINRILFTVLLLSFPVISFGQTVSKDNIFTINDFSGGLNSKASPLALSKNAADIAENVRYDTQNKALSKRDKVLIYGTAHATNPILVMHRFYLAYATKVLMVN